MLILASDQVDAWNTRAPADPPQPGAERTVTLKMQFAVSHDTHWFCLGGLCIGYITQNAAGRWEWKGDLFDVSEWDYATLDAAKEAALATAQAAVEAELTGRG
jgi:hypothetical protein